jgi:hypothetical protein
VTLSTAEITTLIGSFLPSATIRDLLYSFAPEDQVLELELPELTRRPVEETERARLVLLASLLARLHKISDDIQQLHGVLHAELVDHAGRLPAEPASQVENIACLRVCGQLPDILRLGLPEPELGDLLRALLDRLLQLEL